MKTRKIIFLSLLFFMLAFRLLPMFSNSGHNSLPQKSVNDTTTSPNEHTDFIVEQINKAEREKELTNLGNLSELIEKKELEEKQTQTLYAGEFKSVNKINTTGFISIEKNQNETYLLFRNFRTDPKALFFSLGENETYKSPTYKNALQSTIGDQSYVLSLFTDNASLLYVLLCDLDCNTTFGIATLQRQDKGE
ncbi:hypothetical protein H6501_01110 [Candidatus Woesearchaeota archaeon]|nr:hypothetical protein [Nanoarchaeota archaeon]MCB9370175.1 hypothetical protein [Candidatus Woesearchaeota archaeon]USN44705.1 MAG: hypothetical protein H6500_02585 [Candidatus Woesearchaeota archaeon]